MTDARFLQVFVTVPSAEVGDQIASRVVEERLAACVQRMGPIRSVYRWQGNIESSEEWLLVLKTDGDSWPALRERIVALHSYEVPEILALPVVEGHPPYLRWVAESLRRDKASPET